MRWLVVLIALAACRNDLGVGQAPELRTTGPALAAPDAGPPPVPAIRTSIDVRVTATGAPVQGAEVHLSDGTGPSVATATTDEQGIARFDDLAPGPYELWARRERDVSPVARLVRGPDDTVVPAELALAAGGAIHGAITADGALPSSASVRLEPVGVDHAIREARLDAQGGFAFDGVPTGKWRVVVDAQGFFRDVDDVFAVSTAVVTVAIPLRRGGRASGVVVDAAGAPVANATLVVRDRDGYRRPVSTSAARLRWVHPLASPRQMPRFDMSHFGAARPGYRPPECGRGHCGVDLGGKKGTPVHAAADGEVTAVVRQIRPEAGRYVVVEHAGGVQTHYLHLDEIREDLVPGMRVRAGDPLGTVGATGAAAGPHLHFAMSQEREGRSYYLDPEPMLRHAVVLAKPRGLDWNAPVDLGPVVADTTTVAPPRLATDATGAFQVDGLVPGDYVITAYSPKLAPGTSAPFTVRSGELTSGVTITLTPGVEIAGRVLGRGVPIAGARVVAEEGVGESMHRIATAYTNAAGEYALHAVAGEVMLVASAPGQGRAERTIDLGQSGEPRREDFELVVEDGKLFGEVRDADGRAVGGVAVKIVEGATTRRKTTTDPTGSFLIAGVPPGDYVLELSSPDHPATRAPITTDRSISVTLERGASLRIDLRDAHTGDGLARVQVDATGPGDRELHPVTDAAGLAVVRGLTPGRWTFRAHASGYATVVRELDVAGADLDLRLELVRGAVLAGVVRDSFGRRASGARVWVGDVETHADNDGNFQIADAPTGSIELHAALGEETAAQAIELRPGDEILSVTLDLHQDR